MAGLVESRGWRVPVHQGPASVDNLLSTLVAWARRNGKNPRAFSLTYVDGGHALLLRGFDRGTLLSFLSYARSQAYPPLECGAPSELDEPHPRAEAVEEPAPAVAPTRPRPSPLLPPSDGLSSGSIRMVIGTAHVLADRGTLVVEAEHWLAGILGTSDLQARDVGLCLRLLEIPDADPELVALAESRLLRHEGVGLLDVPPDQIPARLRGEGQSATPTAAAAGTVRKVRRKRSPTAPIVGAGPEPASPPPVAAPDPETKLKIDVYGQALRHRAQHWQEILQRLREAAAADSTPRRGVLEGAVFLHEDEAGVQWVLPQRRSPVVQALAEYVQEAHRLLVEEGKRRSEPASWASPSRQGTYAALEAARRTSLVALALGVECRWVVLLSTSFQQGEEESFGLAVGPQSPFRPEGVPAPERAEGEVEPGGLGQFETTLHEPLQAWMRREGIHLGLIRPRATGPPPAEG